MTPQGAFLLYIKAHTGLAGHEPARVVQVDKLSPHFLTLYRSEKIGDVGGIAFNRTTPTGKHDKNIVEFFHKNWQFKINLTADGVKSRLRRLRPQEAAHLAVIDAEYEMHRQAMQALAADRKALLREAFTRGHAVTITELRQAAEAKATLQEVVGES